MTETGIPKNFINDLSHRIEIVELVGSYVKLIRQGSRWWGLCPFHTEKTPSFNVNPDNDLYYCFGCNKGGGIYQFIMEMEGVNFPEAVRLLARRAGIQMPKVSTTILKDDNRDSLEELYRRVSGTFRWFLEKKDSAEHARNYLRMRGISEKTAKDYQLGWAPKDGEWLYNFLIKKNYSSDFLMKSGLFSKKSPQWSIFVNRVMFPIMPSENRVIGFSARAMNNEGPKYINTPETLIYHKSHELYGMAQAKIAIRKERRAHLCEGNVDVLSFAEIDIRSAVAPLGTAFTDEQAKLIKRRADSVIIIFDADEAGEKATIKAASIAETAGLEVQAVRLPQGMDPAEILNQSGAENLKEMLSDPINIVEYMLECRPSRQAKDPVKARLDVLADLRPYLLSVSLEVRRSAYIEYISDNLHLSSESILAYLKEGVPFRSLKTNSSQRVSSRTSVSDLGNFNYTNELYLMAAVVLNPEYFAKVHKEIIPEMFRDFRALALYRALEEFSKESTLPGTDEIIMSLEDDNLKRFILEKSAEGVFNREVEKTIDEKIRGLRIRILTEEHERLQKQISNTINIGSRDNIIPLRMKRIMEINEEVERINQNKDDRNYD